MNPETALKHSNDLILVTGATGNVGREVVRELEARGARIRLAGRSIEELRAVFGDRHELARLEFGDSGTYDTAFTGVTKMFLMRPPQIADVEKRINPAIDAAVRCGVKHIAFLSLQGVERNPVVPHAKVEKHLMKIGVPYTMLRASFFMQNLTGPHRQDIRDMNEIIVPAGRGKTSFVDVRDIAAVAAMALTEPGHEFKAYELTGSEALDYYGAASVLSQVLGRKIEYRNPSLARFWRVRRSRGEAPMMILIMSALYTVCRYGWAAGLTTEVRRLLGRDPISFEQFARDNAAAWS